MNSPPGTVATRPLAVLPNQPATVGEPSAGYVRDTAADGGAIPLAVFALPPPTVANAWLAVPAMPPPTVAWAPLAVFELPATDGGLQTAGCVRPAATDDGVGAIRGRAKVVADRFFAPPPTVPQLSVTLLAVVASDGAAQLPPAIVAA
jgi:hypothetical protein